MNKEDAEEKEKAPPEIVDLVNKFGEFLGKNSGNLGKKQVYFCALYCLYGNLLESAASQEKSISETKELFQELVEYVYMVAEQNLKRGTIK
jgi:hypothetical protein